MWWKKSLYGKKRNEEGYGQREKIVKERRINENGPAPHDEIIHEKNVHKHD